MPQVSVIIPTYNRSALVKEAVESVLTQTLGDLEVLVVDDGSTDDTRRVIETIPDKRVRYFYKENGGVSSARNIGLKNATGEYIAFLDSDDLWEPDYLNAMISAIKKDEKYGAAYTTLHQHYADGHEKKKYREKHCVSGRITCNFFNIVFIWLQTLVVRKKNLEGCYFDEKLRSSGDIDFILRLTLKAEFLYVESNLVKRRIQTNSICKVNNESLVSINKAFVLERFYNEHKEVFADKSKACKKISGTYKEIGERYYNKKDFQNTLYSAKKAIHYNRINIKNYILAAKSFLKLR
jgi:glycosyltransferase involved in cell wall biosynthesis